MNTIYFNIAHEKDTIFFLISEKDITAFGEDDEGEMKRIEKVKDKDGILTGITLRERLLSVILFKAHFLLNLFAFSKYHKRRDFFNILL